MPKKGKKGVDQRVKGNVQSASSGRMSELLGGDAGGFIGFDSVSSISSNNEDDPLLRINSNFQVVMKQLGKRDTITKIKALQEYISLCEQEPPEAVLSSLQLWPLMYTKLAMDSDYRVRELSHKGHRSCCEAVGRSLGPHVRSLIGPWVTGMTDPHLPSALMAQTAFSVCFTSPAKQIEAFKFGLKAIVTFCSDIILKESPDTFSDPKTMPEDERIQRYERAVVMAINGYGYCLQKLGKEVLSEDGVGVVWAGLVKENRLWKLMKHNYPLIRAAVITLVRTLVTCTAYVSEHPAQFCPLVLSHLDESNPLVVATLWETALLLIRSIHNWYECVNIQKALLPGLWSLLGNGGHGNAHVIYPCLLPLLSELLKTSQETSSGLAANFITRLKSGFTSDVVKGSSTETSHISRALIECTGHCLGLSFSGETPFIRELINIVNELIDLIFIVPAVQLEELTACICELINLLVIKGVSPLYLNELRASLTDKLFQQLKDKENTKSLPRIASLLVKFYDNLPPATVSTTTVSIATNAPIITISPATHALILPTITEVVSDALLTYNTLSHLILVQSLVRVLSRTEGGTTEWISHVTKLVRAGSHVTKLVQADSHVTKLVRADNEQGDDHYKDICDVFINLLPKEEGKEEEEREDILVDCYVNTIYSGNILTEERITELLLYLAQVNMKLLPLILIKLSMYHHEHHFLNLSKHFHSFLLPSNSTLTNTHYWSFLHTLLTATQMECPTENTSLLVNEILQGCVKLLISEESDEIFGKLLKLFTNIRPWGVELIAKDIVVLLIHFLNLLLSTTTGEFQFDAVSLINCYCHLVSNLSEEKRDGYLLRAAVIVTDREKNSQIDILYHGLIYYSLHHSLISSSSSSLLEIYQSVLKEALSDKVNYITPKLLVKCCHGDIPFSPSLLPLMLITSLPRPLSLCLLPLVGSCDLPILTQLMEEGLEQYTLTKVLLTRLPEKKNELVNEGAWLMGVVSSLMISILCEYSSHDDSLVLTLVNSSLEWLLRNNNSNNEYLMKTVQYLLNRASDSGLLSSLSLHKLTTLIYITNTSNNGTELLSTQNTLEIKKEVNTSTSQEVTIATSLLSSQEVTDTAVRKGGVVDINDLVQYIRDESDSCPLAGLYALEHVVKKDGPIHLGTKDINDPCQIAALLMINQLNLSDEVVTSTLSSLVSSEDLNLFGDIKESSTDPMVYSLMVLLGGVVNSESLIEKYWDFLSCILLTIIQLMVESINELTLEGVVLCCRGLHITETLHVLLMSTSPAHLIKERSEWVEFFSHTIVNLLLPIFTKPLTTPTNYGSELLRYFLCRALDSLMTTPPVAMWEELLTMVTSRSQYSDQLTACKLAQRCLMSIRIIGEEEEEREEGKRTNSQERQIKVSTFQSCLDSLLDQTEEWEPVLIDDEQESVGSSLGTVFLWLLIVESIGRCHLEVRALMTEWIKGRGQLFPLLHSLLEHCVVAIATPNLNIDQMKITLTPVMSSICSCVFMSVARYIPHLFRQWYLSLDRQTSTVISSFTTRHISQRLWRQEVENMSTNTKIGNLEVRVCGGVSEIIVIYRIDEFSIELTVCIPDNYPLGPPTIREGKRAKVDLSLWRKWLLQLNSFVANQNGSILEGLLLWKSNLDKHFAGLDDCMICFSIIHGSNYSLPKMLCKTCKKRFHSSCLYKWFSTSNKNTCPLCRNVF